MMANTTKPAVACDRLPGLGVSAIACNRLPLLLPSDLSIIDLILVNEVQSRKGGQGIDQAFPAEPAESRSPAYLGPSKIR